MASGKPNKLAFLSMPAPASYVAGLGRGYVFRIFSQIFGSLHSSASGFTTRSDIGPAREGPSAEVIAYENNYFYTILSHILIPKSREAQAKRGEETEVDPEQFQDPDNEYGLFAGTTYEQDDEEADKIYEGVDEAMDSRRRARRCVMVSLLVDSLFGLPSSRLEKRRNKLNWPNTAPSDPRYNSNSPISNVDCPQ